MWTLLAVFGAGALILISLALRNRVAFKMAARNIPRRKTQSVLIVAGLMLATLLFSASFTTGDTLTNSIRTQALEQIGQTDVVVKKDARSPAASSPVPNKQHTSTRTSSARSKTGSPATKKSRAWLP